MSASAEPLEDVLREYTRDLEWIGEPTHYPDKLPAGRIDVRVTVRLTCPCCRQMHRAVGPSWSLLRSVPTSHPSQDSGLVYILKVSHPDSKLPPNYFHYVPRALDTEVWSFLRQNWRCERCAVSFGLLPDEQSRLYKEITEEFSLEVVEEIIRTFDHPHRGQWIAHDRKREWTLKLK